eukprot:9289735-Karenia_brevis.AAC.1
MGIDLEFAIHMYVTLGPDLLQWRQAQIQKFQNLVSDCKNLDKLIQATVPQGPDRVVGSVPTGLILVLTYIMLWPDWEVPDRIVQ